MEDLFDDAFGFGDGLLGQFVAFEQGLNVVVFEGLFVLRLDFLSGHGKALHVTVDLLDVWFEGSFHFLGPELLPVKTIKPRMIVKLFDSF